MVRKPTLKVGLKYLGYYSPFLATDVTVPPLLAEQPKEEGEVGSQSAAPDEGIELLFIVSMILDLVQSSGPGQGISA